MGLILDSTVCVAAERRGATPAALIAHLPAPARDELLAISVITLHEMAYGLVRAESDRRRASRQTFLSDLQQALKVYPVTASIAVRAGMLRATLQMQGQVIELADLLIAAAALELGYSVVTANIRHFRRVPGLRVVES